MSETTGSPRDGKRALRASLVAARARLTPGEREERSRAIARRVEDLPAFRSARILAAYGALGAEVDPSTLVAAALARGARVVYPSVRGDGRRLVFAACLPAALTRGALGAAEPPPAAPEVSGEAIDLVLVPGVGFSPDGHRLGRGGGYYDATLAAMPRAYRVGLAFEQQIVAALPAEPHDARLDAIATEARLLLVDRDSR